MKKKRDIQKKSKLNKFEEEFVSFGNKRNVFWSITFTTIILSLLGIPLMLSNENFLKRFLVIWILEVIYIGMYVKWGERKNNKKRTNKSSN